MTTKKSNNATYFPGRRLTDGSRPQGTYFIQNSATNRCFTSYTTLNLIETPLWVWPVSSVDHNSAYNQFDIEYTGHEDKYYIRNTPPGATAPLYLSHNAPSAPQLSAAQQTIRLLSTPTSDVFFISTATSHTSIPHTVLTDQNAPQNPATELRPNAERLDPKDSRQKWIFKRSLS